MTTEGVDIHSVGNTQVSRMRPVVMFLCCVCVRAYMRARVHACVCIRACVYVCVCVRIYVLCMYYVWYQAVQVTKLHSTDYLTLTMSFKT